MKQTDRVPHKARGAAQSAGAPVQSAGTTKTSYPLMKYLSLLLAVALLFSGVTFARYLSNDQIDASVGIAAFDATYSVDRVNTTTFGNENYWIETGTSGNIPQGAGSEITVGITLKNNGDTSVQPTLHLEGPKEYWDNIALQLTTTRNVTPGDVAAGVVLTPQLVIGDIVKAPKGEFNTGSSKDYGSLGGEDVTLALKGSIDADADGVRTATWKANGFENKMTITKKTDTTIDYSVGFVRQSEDDFLPPIYVDCRKETDIYSIDLELPALNVDAAESADGSRTAQTKKVVVWLTWTSAAPNNSQEADEGFWTAIAKGEAPGGVKDQSGKPITILGYHFDVSGVPVTDASGNEKGETTTVRVKNTFGDTAGVLTTEYFHIASLDEEGQDSAYPHAAELVEGEEYIYLCGGPSPTYFDVSDVESTFTNEDINLIKWEEVKDAEEGDITSITYAPVHGRSFGISFRATFVQSSEVPKI